MTIAITGATGHLGRLVINQLKDQVPASDLVALVRSPAKASDLGVSAREADYSKPETLDRALAGVNTLLLISSSEVGQRAVQHHNLISAAKNQGVKRIVYTSLLHADTSALSLADEHRETEAELKASGLLFTILRNGWYTENYTASVSSAVTGGAFLGSADGGRISSAARVDYAEAAVAVLTSEGHDGKTYELAGDNAYTLSDLAAEISRQTGRDIPYRDLRETEYAAALASFGLPETAARAYASFDVAAAQGALFDDGRQLSQLIGRPTTQLAVSVAEALAISQWTSTHEDIARIVKETLPWMGRGPPTYAQKQREEIVRALTECNGRVGGADGAAARMGINRTTLISRMKKLGIDPRRYAS